MSVIHGYNIGSDKIPTLDLNFANKKSLIDSISNEIEVEFTRTQDTPSSYYKSDGTIGYASTDVPRFDHDPVTGESLGLLIEESRTNLTTYSQEFATNWTAYNANVVPNSIISPDGTLTGSKLAIDSTNNAHFIEIINVSNSVPRIVSVFAKPAEHSIISLGTFLDATGPYRSIDLVTGEVKQSAGNIGTWGIEDYGNGWKRVWMEVLETSTSRDNFYIGVTKPDGPTFRITDTWQGNPGEGLYIWGAQLEEGSFPTSYIPTPATFTSRSTTATYYDANGIIQTAAIDEARDDAYFPDENGNFISAGLLLEEERTNLLTYSEDFGNGAYIKDAGVSVTINSITSPSGSTSADLISVPDNGRIYANNTSLTGVCSVYIKAGTFSHFSVLGCFVDLTVPSTTAGILVDVGNGWYRIVSDERTSIRHFQVQAYPDNTYLPHSTAGTYYLWGAQLEEGSYPTSYIPTDGTPGGIARAADISSSNTSIRGADTASITGAGFSSFYNPYEGTFYLDLPTTLVSVDNNDIIFSANNGSSDENVLLQWATITPYWKASGAQVATSPAKGSDAVTGKYAMAWDSSTIGAATDGNAAVTTTSATVPTTATALNIFTGGSGVRPVYGHISRLTYWPKRLPDSDLQYLTK